MHLVQFPLFSYADKNDKQGKLSISATLPLLLLLPGFPSLPLPPPFKNMCECFGYINAQPPAYKSPSPISSREISI